MASTGRLPEACFSRVLKVLREDGELQKYIKKYFESPREDAAITEIPCLMFNVAAVAEKPLTDPAYVLDVTIKLEIIGFVCVHNVEAQQWFGDRGKGLQRVIQDIKKALAADHLTNLNGTCDYFTFGETTIQDGYPTKGFILPLLIHLKEYQGDRDRRP